MAGTGIMTGICTSPYPSPYPIEKVGDSPYTYIYPYPINSEILHQNGNGFGLYSRRRVYLSSLGVNFLKLHFSLNKKCSRKSTFYLSLIFVQVKHFFSTKNGVDNEPWSYFRYENRESIQPCYHVVFDQEMKFSFKTSNFY